MEAASNDLHDDLDAITSGETLKVQRFAKLFGKQFDYEALANGTSHPPPVDTPENLNLLSKLHTSGDVYFMHMRIGEELSGVFICDRNLDNLDLRQEGSSLFKRGRFEEALEIYKKAIILNPFEVRNFTNAAVTLIQLGQNEAANTIASIGTDVEPRFAKVHLLIIKSYCNLGYVDSAKTYAENVIDKIPSNELYSFVDEFHKLVDEVPPDRVKKMDESDYEEMKRRLFSPNEGMPEVYAFLLHHFLELTAQSEESMSKKNFPVLMELMTQMPYVKDFFEDPASSMASLGVGESRVVGLFVTMLKYHCSDGVEPCLKLVSNPTFTSFFPKWAYALMKRSTIGSTMANIGPGYLAGCFFGSFIYLLSSLAKYPAIRNGFLKETPPFNDFPLYVYLMALDPCVFDTRDSPNTGTFIETFTSVMCESWFLEKMEKSLSDEHFDNAISILTTVSTIFLLCRSVNLREENPPFASFLPLWLELSKSSRFCPLLSRRPGVWYHFAIRLEYATCELDSYIAHRHHRTHLDETLEVLKNLSKHLESMQVLDEYATLKFQTSFASLLQFCTKKFKPRLATFADSFVKNSLKTLLHFFEISTNFTKDFLILDEEEPLLVTVALLGLRRGSEVTKVAWKCLKFLLKGGETEQVSEFMDSESFSVFIGNLVQGPLMEASKENVEAGCMSIELLRILAESCQENDIRLAEATTTTEIITGNATSTIGRNPHFIVKGIATVMKNAPSVSSEAIRLLAKLAMASGDYRESLGRASEEITGPILAATKEKLDACKCEDERKLLEGLVSVLKI